MKLISWNVNGLRACLTHDFAASFAALDADVFSVQETKMQPGQADFAPEGYTEYTYSAEKKGYSGTACWCKTPPLRVTTGIGREEHDHEGRALEAKAGRGLVAALLLFVGIPLPGTGAWTGTLAASILDMKFKDVLVACMGGVLLAGIIMGLASAGLLGALSGLFAV